MWWKVGLLSAILRDWIGAARVEKKVENEEEIIEEEGYTSTYLYKP